jgi:hypothetical protein
MDSDLTSHSADHDADDPRFVMAALAARRARRNRPRRFVILAGLILLAAGAVAGWGALQRGQAAAALRRARADQDVVTQLVAQYEEAKARGTRNPYAPALDLVTRLGSLARQAGLSLPDSESNSAPSGALQEARVTYNNIRTRDLEPVFTWLARVHEQIPGFEFDQL